MTAGEATSVHTPTAVIIGAGPAGLTAAYELLEHTDIKPIVFEMSDQVGGISKTVNYKGNRIDIGGHRFFSKSDRVMRWWARFLPVQGEPGSGGDVRIAYQGKEREVSLDGSGPDPEETDQVMLLRSRTSRILHRRRLFAYPLSLNLATLKNLGPVRVFRIGFSYLRSVFFPIREEKTLEDFFINRFGRELYHTFFKDYTEKVWGEKCSDIGADWGAQRIKGLSITRAVIHALKSGLRLDRSGVAQKTTETSLIERFLYPKLGPGQMWEEVAKQVVAKGGELHLGWQATDFELVDDRIRAVTLVNRENSGRRRIEADYVFSTMPMQQLVLGMGSAVPEPVRELARNLKYRDFITVGLLLKRLRLQEEDSSSEMLLRDNWIYIQEKDVRVGRLQIFNNWSPYMVRDPDTVWVGLEYFCNEGDDLWSLEDERLIELAVSEMETIGVARLDDKLDATVIRMPKAYPGYFGESYRRIEEIRRFTDSLENLYLVGRNGMHRYNNQDHSMLTAMTAVDNIRRNIRNRENIWQVNTESDYHEKKEGDDAVATSRLSPAS